MGLELLIVAWDGAPLEPVRRWVEGGLLPVLRDLAGPGGIRPLRSTIPPITPTAWASFHLGVNPGKHGIYDFLDYELGGRVRILCAQDFPFPTFWELLAEGIPVGVVGFPMGYPSRKLKRGFWIPGFLAPNRALSHPPEALWSVRHAVGTFPFTPPPPRPGAQWIGELVECIHRRTRAALLLARKYRPAVMGVHFQSTDAVLHARWGKPEAEEVFAAADRALGELMDGLSPKAVILLSDHGMGPVGMDFHLNTWLWRAGFLRFRRGIWRITKTALFSAGLTPVRIQGLAEALARALDRFPPARDLASFWRGALVGRILFPSLGDVDRRRTRAYSLGGMGAIRLLENRWESEIRRALQEVRAPDGTPVVEEVLTPGDVYWGGRLGAAPSLIPVYREGILPLSHFLFLNADPFSPPSLPAHHRSYGILWHNAPLDLPPVPAIWEVAPAILRYLGFDTPSHMDAGVRTGAVEKCIPNRYL